MRGANPAWRRCGLRWAAEEPRGRALAYTMRGLMSAEELRGRALSVATMRGWPLRSRGRALAYDDVADGPLSRAVELRAAGPAAVCS